jgi:hypothetical protein
MTRTGGCLCGQLRYTLEGEPRMSGKCYCPDCRRETGTGHMTFLSYPAEAVTLSGDARTYTQAGGSGADVVRTFCPSCGTTVFGHPTVMGDVRAVRAGTLDDPSGLTMVFAVYCGVAVDWDQPPAGLKAFATMP